MNCPVCGTEYNYTGSPYTYIQMEGDKVMFAECVHGKRTADKIPTIEEVWKMTEKCPSLTDMLLEGR